MPVEILDHENGPNVSPTVRTISATAATKSLDSLSVLFGGDGDFFGRSRLHVGVSKKEIACSWPLGTTWRRT